MAWLAIVSAALAVALVVMLVLIWKFAKLFKTWVRKISGRRAGPAILVNR